MVCKKYDLPLIHAVDKFTSLCQNLIDLEQIRNSEIFYYFSNENKVSFSDRGRGYFRREWTRLAWMAMDGKYHEANHLRADLVRQARDIHGLSEIYTPNFMERGWTTHFGHLACLFAFDDAQKFNILPNIRRLVLNSSSFAKNRPIFRIIKDSFDFIDVKSKTSIFDTETYFPLTEKVSFLSAGSRFLELTQFLNEVGEANRRINPGTRINVPFTDREMSTIKALFAKNGMSDQVPFVALHIRETEDKYSDRNSRTLSFLPTIKYLIDSGTYVLRIGSKSGGNLPQCPGLLDLAGLKDEMSFLHEYAIANAKFFITSQSGPSAFAHLIGVPTLTVDALAIARSTYTTRALSMSLPKKLKNDSGVNLPWECFFENKISFREYGFQVGEFKLCNNNSYEILCAVKELESNLKVDYLKLRNPISFVEAKKAVGGNGIGLVSTQFFS